MTYMIGFPSNQIVESMALETMDENDYESRDGQSPAKQLRLVVNIHHPLAFGI